MKHHNNIFHQLLKVIPRHEFQKVVDRHNGDYKVRTLPCWTQFVVMMFAQLAQRVSLRDLTDNFNACHNHHYHLGVSCVQRSSLSDANSNRSALIFAEVFYFLLHRVREQLPKAVEKEIVRLIDSTTIDVNLNGVFYCSKHTVAKAMKPRQSGVIVNIGSTAGIIGKDRRMYAGTTMGGATLDYHAAKGAVVNMTRDMAVYLAPDNIRVNCISPGGFERGQAANFIDAYSETVPMRRMGVDRKEMKGAVVFLASEASSYITGHNLVVDGGLSAW